MRSLGLLCSFCLLSSVVSQTIPELLRNVTQAFYDAKIVPDVIEAVKLSAFVNMRFTDDSGESVTPSPGEILTMLQTSVDPVYFMTAEDPASLLGEKFVLIITDPDAPTPQNTSTSQIIHFLAGNFTLGSSGSLLTNNSATFMQYWMPRPQVGSDPHRYVLFVYHQPPTFDTEVVNFFPDPTDEPTRTKFNLSSFATLMNLGEPIAGNFFVVGPNQTSTTTGTNTLATTTASVGQPTLTPLSGVAYGLAAKPIEVLGLFMATLIFALT